LHKVNLQVVVTGIEPQDVITKDNVTVTVDAVVYYRDGELRASRRLANAAAVMDATSTSLQLRLLQTVVDVAAEKNTTLVMPFPVEILRFVDHQKTAASKQAPGANSAATSRHNGAGRLHDVSKS
jgi:hypothetical protein